MKTLIFDFDGTLADSFNTLLEIYEEIMRRPQRLMAAEVKELRGKSPNEVLKYLKIKRWQIPRLILRGRQMVALKLSGIKTFPGLSGSIRQLHLNGFRMYVVSTNSPQNIRLFLKNNGLEDDFAGVYGNVGLFGKAAALRKIVKKEKLNPDDCYYICDEVRDIEAARKAKITAVAVAWGFNFPDILQTASPAAIAYTPKDLVSIFFR